MIIVILKGGLGNQLFQFAYGKMISETFNIPLKFDLSFLKRRDKDVDYTIRDFKLSEFNIKLEIASTEDLIYCKSLKGKFYKRLNKYRYKKGLKPLSKSVVAGYWQGEFYFKDQKETILDSIKFKELKDDISKNYFEQIKSYNNSVAIHVRRGDYINNSLHAVCSDEYYLDAIKEIKTKLTDCTFFVFSDDIDYCKSLFKNETIKFVEGVKTDTDDFQLMSLCNHKIISNSSFSWWATYLNQDDNQIVISPDKWLNDVKKNNQFINHDGIILNDWIKIPC